MTFLGKCRSFLETFVIGFLGVALFYSVHIPLPWLLGSLSAVMIWRVITKRHLLWPHYLRQVALMLLGYLLGTSFSVNTPIQMVGQIPSMLFVTVLTIFASVVLGYGFSKITGLDGLSCIIGSVPGGLSQMMVLGEEIQGVNPTIVAFMQMMRLLTVIFIVPLLTLHVLADNSGMSKTVTTMETSITWMEMPSYSFVMYPVLIMIGAVVANRIKLPTAYLTGPLIVTIALMLKGLSVPPPPNFLVIVAQLFIGIYIGLQFNPMEIHHWKKVVLYALGTGVLLVMFSLGVGYMLTRWHSIELSSSFLAVAPGGIAEMGVTAVTVGADLSIVSSYQLFRLLTIMFVVPYLLKWMAMRSRDF